MQTYKNPLKTTVKGLNNSANVKVVVRHIQNKIVDYGICSDKEYDYLVKYAGADAPNAFRPN